MRRPLGNHAQGGAWSDALHCRGLALVRDVNHGVVDVYAPFEVCEGDLLLRGVLAPPVELLYRGPDHVRFDFLSSESDVVAHATTRIVFSSHQLCHFRVRESICKVSNSRKAGDVRAARFRMSRTTTRAARRPVITVLPLRGQCCLATTRRRTFEGGSAFRFGR